MNVLSVAQCTKPKFKDIQTIQKVAWIAGISVSIILNIVLAVLCGIWNNERLTLKTDKDSLQHDFNQCQNNLYQCQYSSQKTCNNTVYKAGDKIILFNYSQNIQSSNLSNITDTIEIKDNGDVYINNKEATTEECKTLPQEIYLVNNDNNYYTYDISNFVKNTPQENTVINKLKGTLQGTINCKYTDKLVLELNNNQIYPLENTVYFEANNTWYSVKGPSQVLSYNPVKDNKLNGALEIGGLTNPALTIKGIWGDENSDISTIQINNVTEEENIQQTSLLGTGCKVNNLGVCLSPSNERYYKYTYTDTEGNSQDEYIQFVFDQEPVQEPQEASLSVEISNGQINIDGQQFVYNENKQLISINGNYTTKSGLMTISADHKTLSNYGISINSYSTNASVCDISSNQNSSSKSDCYYPWNNTFQIRDGNNYVYQIKVNNNKNYTQLYPDEYVNECVNESIINQSSQTNKIRGNITIVDILENNNQKFSLIKVKGVFDQSTFDEMSSTVELRGKFKNRQQGYTACVNVTTESVIESQYGILLDNVKITSEQNNIRVTMQSSLTSKQDIPVFFGDNVTITAGINQTVAIKVPSFNKITGNNLVCQVSTLQSPSNQSQCLQQPTPISSNKISFKYTQDNMNYYYTLQGPQEKIYSGDIPVNDSTAIISSVQLGNNKELNISGSFGEKSSSVDSGITITPVEVWGTINSISIQNTSSGTLHGQVNINTNIDSTNQGIMLGSNISFTNCLFGVYVSGKVSGSNSGIYIVGDVGDANNSQYGIYQVSGYIQGNQIGFAQEKTGTIYGPSSGIQLKGTIQGNSVNNSIGIMLEDSVSFDYYQNGIYVNGIVKGSNSGIFVNGTVGDFAKSEYGIYQNSSSHIYGKQVGFISQSNGLIQGNNSGISIRGGITSNTTCVDIQSSVQFRNCTTGIAVNGKVNGSNIGIYLNADVGHIAQNSSDGVNSIYGIYQESGTIQGDKSGIQISGTVKGINSINIDSSSILTASQCKVKNGDTCLLNP